MPPTTFAPNVESSLSAIARYQLMPQLIREQLIDQAIAPLSCSPAQIEVALQTFYQHHQLDTIEEQQAWRDRYQLKTTDVIDLATRSLRIEQFKEQLWGNKLESYFLKRKADLDRATYSLIRVQDPALAQELFFRLQAQEQSLAALAKTYSEGPEAKSDGQVGPVAMGAIHPHLAKCLRVSQPGQLWPPTRLGSWSVIVQLNQWLPVQLDAAMGQQLLNELYELWLQAQIQQLPPGDRAWFPSTHLTQQM